MDDEFDLPDLGNAPDVRDSEENFTQKIKAANAKLLVPRKHKQLLPQKKQKLKNECEKGARAEKISAEKESREEEADATKKAKEHRLHTKKEANAQKPAAKIKAKAQYEAAKALLSNFNSL